MEAELESNSIDKSIEICEHHISKHRRSAFYMLSIILVLIGAFIALQSFQFVIERDNIDRLDEISSTARLTSYSVDHSVQRSYEVIDLLDKMYMAHDDSIIDATDKLILQTISDIQIDTNQLSTTLSKLINLSDQAPKAIEAIPESTVYFVYGIFILLFGLVTSFYRFHLKEISKNEHYLLGFHRIRVAGNNSETGYEDYAKYYLTKDAFATVDSGKSGKVDSPLPGHPTSDLSVEMLNKIFDRLEIKKKG
jgi:hypothetical protein